MTAARLIGELVGDDRSMLVVEHDLAILDLLADSLHVAYGEPGAYGVITDPKSVKNGINEYLSGYLDNENMRIRPNAIEFEQHAPRSSTAGETLVEYPDIAKSYGDGEFSLTWRAAPSTRTRYWASWAPTASGSPPSRNF